MSTVRIVAMTARRFNLTWSGQSLKDTMTKARKLHTFKVGDRVELLLFYSFHNDPLPQGTIVGASSKSIRAKLDRSGKVVRFDPTRVIASKASLRVRKTK